jgi:hypothetical protein
MVSRSFLLKVAWRWNCVSGARREQRETSIQRCGPQLPILLPTSTQHFDRASETSPRLELRSNRFGALLPDGIVAAFEASGFEMLPISSRHATDAPALPPHHRDPFDPMLIAQAECEGLVIVTADRQFDAYDVETLNASA